MLDYETLYVSPLKANGLEELRMIREAAEDGWELVAACPIFEESLSYQLKDGGKVLYFRRPQGYVKRG